MNADLRRLDRHLLALLLTLMAALPACGEGLLTTGQGDGGVPHDVSTSPEDQDVDAVDAGMDDATYDAELAEDAALVAPTGLSIQVEEGPQVRAPDIVLLLDAVGAAQMRIAEVSGFAGVSWGPFARRQPWRLSDGEGIKTIFAQFSGEDGALSAVISTTTTLRTSARHVVAVGPEAFVGDGGSRPSVAIDGRDQPHIAVNDGGQTRIFLHHRIDGVWSGGLLGSARDFSDQGQLMETPHLEIDPRGRGWISGHLFRSDVVEACGHAVFLVGNIDSAPQTLWARRYYRHWGHGNLSLDPARPDEAIVMTFNGQWLRVNGQGEAGEQGEMYPGTTGEKVDFRIAPSAGQTGVWHAMHSGYSRSSSSYQNSVRHARGEPIVVWAAHGCYPEQGLDTRRPAIGVDRSDPEVAYFSVKYDPGVVINIWDGQRMVFPDCQLPVIEPEPRDQGNGTFRFAPQWAPALGGGAFLCWTHASEEVRLRYVGRDGTLGDVVVVGAGQQCAAATDSAGQLHVAYIRNGGLHYRRLTVE